MARCFVTLVLLISLAGCGHGVAESSGEKKAEEEGAEVTVRTQNAQQRSIAESVTGLGRCEALPQRLALLTAAVEGRVTRLLVPPGDTVEPGQPIVELDPAVAQANLEEKKTAKDAQEASLRLLESLPRPEEQNNAKLAIEQARLAVDKARATVDHLQPLRQRNEISASALFEAETALRQAELQWKSAQAQYEVLMLHPRPQAVEEAKSRIVMMEAAVKTAQSQLDLHTIRSPIRGMLDNLNCQLGQTLSVGASIGQVVDARQVHVVIWLGVADARSIRRGQTAAIRLGATGVSPVPGATGVSPVPGATGILPVPGATGVSPVPGATGILPVPGATGILPVPSESTGKMPVAPTSGPVGDSIRGEVVFLGTVADSQTGNLPVRILADNAEGKLTLGQTVSATIVVREKIVLAVPAAAVYDLGEGPLVMVLRDGKTVQLHPTPGLKDGGWVEVSGVDLKPGEPVVVEGGYNLPEGKAVKAEAAAEAK